MNLNLPSPLQKIHVNDKVGEIYIKRDDLIHPMISGNKWRKLKFLVESFEGKKIVTYGGAYSNHILAVAAYCNQYDIQSEAYIRGEELHATNPTLSLCKELGMRFHFIDRDAYRNKTTLLRSQSASVIDDQLVIPEGGSTPFVKIGMKQLVDEIREELVEKENLHMYCSYGTGGTAYGILHNLTSLERLTVIPAIKGVTEQRFLENSLVLDCDINTAYEVVYYEEMKRYAAKDMRLFTFCEEFLGTHKILLDPIYTAKVMYYIMHHEKATKSTKVLIHSGGLQAWNGYFFRFPELKNELPLIYDYIRANALSIA